MGVSPDSSTPTPLSTAITSVPYEDSLKSDSAMEVVIEENEMSVGAVTQTRTEIETFEAHAPRTSSAPSPEEIEEREVITTEVITASDALSSVIADGHTAEGEEREHNNRKRRLVNERKGYDDFVTDEQVEVRYYIVPFPLLSISFLLSSFPTPLSLFPFLFHGWTGPRNRCILQ